MKIESKFLSVALQKADEKRRSIGVAFNKEKLKAFQTALDEMAMAKNYNSDKDLYHSDVETIKQHWSDLMLDAAYAFINKDSEFKSKTKLGSYVTEAARYLLAMAQKGVNGAEFSVDTVQELRKMAHSAVTLINSKDKSKNGICGITAEQAFDRQRGKDANDLRSEVSELLSVVGSGKGTSAQLGNLYAEWRALTERQAGHNFVWKLFHLLENSRRNTLLKDMKESIKAMTGGRVPSLDLEPSQIAMNKESDIAGETITESFNDILSEPEEAFGYAEYIENPELLEEFENNRVSLNDSVDFLADVQEKFVDNNDSMNLDDEELIIIKDDKTISKI